MPSSCVHEAAELACGLADGCRPAGCDVETDGDCAPVEME